jgi:hypothetical protein
MEDETMPRDLVEFLTLLVAGGVLGAVLGLLMLRFRRKWAEDYGKTCRNLSWWVFACSTIFFLILAGSQLALGRLSFALGFAGFAVLELVGMAFAVVRKRRLATDSPTIGDDRPPTG